MLETIEINTKDVYIIKAYFSKMKPWKYVSIFPLNMDTDCGIFRIIFKKFIDSDEEANILDADFYTLEPNSGLVIDTTQINYNLANIFIVPYGNVNINIGFLEKSTSSYLINAPIQYSLPKGQSLDLTLTNNKVEVNSISFITKYSLENIDVKIKKENGEELIFDGGGYSYPNGYSAVFYIDKYQSNLFYITITNKKLRD